MRFVAPLGSRRSSEEVVTISFELPQELEQQIRTSGTAPQREARELYLVELYRQDRISHAQLRDALGVSFHEAEKLIRGHGAGHDLPLEEFKNSGPSSKRPASNDGHLRHGPTALLRANRPQRRSAGKLPAGLYAPGPDQRCV